MLTSLISRIFLNSFLIIFMASLILAAKRLLKNHLSLKAQYYLWFPFLFIMAVPFLPDCLLDYIRWDNWFTVFQTTSGTRAGAVTPTLASANQIDSSWLQDFSVSVNRAFSGDFYRILLLLWLTGVLLMTGIAVYSQCKIIHLKSSSLPLKNITACRLYRSCRLELGIARDIPVMTTAFLSSPVTIGMLRPCIILPLHIVSDLSEEKLRYIFMHELLHCKHKDTLINQFAVLSQILYWFHPMVWYALKTMRGDCETACDGSVLSRLDQQDYIAYGITLLDFTAKASKFPCSSVSGMGGSARELKKRILSIRHYHKESAGKKIKSLAVLTIMAALVWMLMPALASDASVGGKYHITQSNTVHVDLSCYFRGYEGCFVIYDRNAGQFSIYNEENAVTRISPVSTYKIYSALTALENGIISPESNTLIWDQTQFSIDAWNKDQTLKSAMQNSVNWYFTALDGQSGLINLQKTLSHIGYGNQNLTGGIGRYWLESSLKISPFEQVELLTKLYQGTLPFDPQNMDYVKDALFLFSSGSSSVYGKTGTGMINNMAGNGWFIGFVESQDNTYIFATNLQGENSATGSMAGQITMDILNGLSVLEK